METIITAKNLTKIYDDFIAVSDISFVVNKGGIFGLSGPNGVGKTTTINMLIGMAKIMGAEPRMEIYDPCCDSSCLLIR